MMRCIAQAKIFDPLAPSSQLQKTIDSQIKCKYSHYFWSSTVDFARSTKLPNARQGSAAIPVCSQEISFASRDSVPLSRQHVSNLGGTGFQCN